ncbi:nuclear transport factor 2 family protein [Massilia norwichensis]|jgi:hypothetical protein|uniref:Nuclear transport factor 2 family protein n=1 Tax=Massilia norwichensis TaxID=1442366 RepID=A0ABT2ACZ1_9BURK|nr:nuclear transport factor 2 family protein [Massilia norwichensis]MCS0592003.1 nuclear transport factor 2 family protein [Massilia norwichensis]
MKAACSALFLAVGLLLTAPHMARADDAAHGRKEIEAVVEAFRATLIKKDKEAFLRLFTKEDITWIGVTTDASVEMLYASRPRPEMKRPPKLFPGTLRGFIDAVAKDPTPQEEVFSNVRIETDGDIAQVWFDYIFMEGSYRANWGKESWQLVRLDAGWKIASVIWSQELNPTPPPKR